MNQEKIKLKIITAALVAAWGAFLILLYYIHQINFNENAVLGAAFQGFGVYIADHIIKYRRNNIRALGKVISLRLKESGDDAFYYPRFEIIESKSDPKSKWFAGQTAMSDIGSMPASYEVGDIVEIHYDPEKNIVTGKKDQVILALFSFLFFWIGTLSILGKLAQ